MKRLLPLLLCSLSVLILPAARLGGQTPASPTIQTGGEAAAQPAAEAWLALTDESRFDASYQATAPIFQKLMTKEQWSKLLVGGRDPLGKVITRKLKDTKSTPTMPGGPDGQYVVIHYETSFEKKTAAFETVTVVLDGDGQWKVCGYFIR